ncbi:MAG TPA: T9SS type A sorting domain-containing protein [Saprospiraceae bacterium]|nr:T9SS type A sorting domain-containing protein [Saprospiraceae bacterium]
MVTAKTQSTFNYILKEDPAGTYNVTLVSTSNDNTNVRIEPTGTFLYLKVSPGITINLTNGWNVLNTITDASIEAGCGSSFGFDFLEIGTGTIINAGPLLENSELILTSFSIAASQDFALSYVGIEPCLSDFFENALQVDINGDNHFVSQTLTGFTILPIHLLSFTAQKRESREVLLEWITTAEFNASHFEIERSEDGHAFYAIGQVKATGEKQEQKVYHFIDRNITLLRRENKIFYYRLRMVDLDQRFAYSEVRGVRIDSDALEKVVVYPNPTSDLLHIALPDEWNDQRIYWDLLDHQGKRVTTGQWNVKTTQTQILYFHQFRLNEGVYILRLYNGKKLLSSHQIVFISR